MSRSALPRQTVDMPSGATMDQQYMRRVVNTYPISETEMDSLSSLSAAASIRFSAASFLATLGAGIWINSIFYVEMTPVGALASEFVAPILIFGATLYGIGGILAQRKRGAKWDEIKNGAKPIQTQAFAASRDVVL